MAKNISFPSLVAVVTLFSWIIFVGFCQGQGSLPPPCLPKLISCQPFLRSNSNATPDASCCLPLKDVVVNDVKCLCDVFNNPAIMKAFDVTQDDALKLAKTCGANANVSLCKTAAAPTVSPATPSQSNSSTSNNHTANAPAKNAAASLISHHFYSSITFSLLFGLLIFAS